MIYIYLIENCFKNLNTVYIGKTKKEGSRINKHKNRFGEDIICTTIDIVLNDNKEIWKPIETFWINYFKFLGFNVQNKNEGGGGCIKASEEMKQKISKANKGKTRTEEQKQRYKYSKTEEHKKNLSKSKIGLPSSKKGKKTGPNLKLKENKERNKKISEWRVNNKEKIVLSKLGKSKKGCKILDIKNNIVFESKILCAQFNNININKMHKLIQQNIHYKKI